MCTVQELVHVTQKALDTYAQVCELERLTGRPPLVAAEVARAAAMREAIVKLCELLECDPCD